MRLSRALAPVATAAGDSMRLNGCARLARRSGRVPNARAFGPKRAGASACPGRIVPRYPI
ncbi:hypothetical protein BSIN_3960 [Burkholderia singularis]|uniref:Uncharacterized protein n=1 Tax=Burkholderia singularis TaxID=1503053 RepID=A0A238H6L6_9BURK|nr:hypothetical protein BSIN_3960 [Burkholderia singularis]